MADQHLRVMRRGPMRLAGTTGMPTLTKHVQCAGVPAVPENELSASWQYLAEGLEKTKKLPHPAPLITMVPNTVLDFFGCFTFSRLR